MLSIILYKYIIQIALNYIYELLNINYKKMDIESKYMEFINLMQKTSKYFVKIYNILIVIYNNNNSIQIKDLLFEFDCTNDAIINLINNFKYIIDEDNDYLVYDIKKNMEIINKYIIEFCEHDINKQNELIDNNYFEDIINNLRIMYKNITIMSDEF